MLVRVVRFVASAFTLCSDVELPKFQYRTPMLGLRDDLTPLRDRGKSWGIQKIDGVSVNFSELTQYVAMYQLRTP
jgi:hypothetical protein